MINIEQLLSHLNRKLNEKPENYLPNDFDSGYQAALKELYGLLNRVRIHRKAEEAIVKQRKLV